MPTSDHRTVLSVRGEAQRTVDPDQASVHCGVSTLADSKPAATEYLKRALSAVTDQLAALGGLALTVDTMRAPLTWSAHSMQTHPEHEHDKTTGRHGPTGRYRASVSVSVAVRDFALLGRVETLLAGQDGLEIHAVQWSVDHENAVWALVRADAIHAALRKGQDYAAALGGSVASVDHVADAGLLGGEARDHLLHQGLAMSAGAPAGRGDVSSLDPVPQVIDAIIEARLTAVTDALPAP